MLYLGQKIIINSNLKNNFFQTNNLIKVDFKFIEN